jgi:Right handed beta helix region
MPWPYWQWQQSRTPMHYENQSGISIFDKTFDREPLLFKHCSAIHISNCRFINNGELLLRFEDCGQIDIHGCHFLGCLGHFIQTAANGLVREVRITKNVLIGNRQPYYLDAQGKRVDNGASGDMIVLRNTHDFCIADNILEGGGEFGITIGFGSTDGLISGNTLREIDATGVLIGTATTSHVERIRIINNLIDTCGRNWNGDSLNQSGIWCRNSVGCQVIGNRILNSVPTSLNYGIQVRDARKLVIRGNTFGNYIDVPLRIPKDLNDTVVELQSDITPRY